MATVCKNCSIKVGKQGSVAEGFQLEIQPDQGRKFCTCDPADRDGSWDEECSLCGYDLCQNCLYPIAST